MDRNEIIHTLLQEPQIKRFCSIGGNYSDDLYQSTWVVILGIPEEKLKHIFNKGYLLFYVFRIIKSIQMQDQKKKRNYIPIEKELKTFDDEYKISTKLEFEIESALKTSDHSDKVNARIELEKVSKTLESMHWYDEKIFRLYLEEGSYRKVEKKTGIGYNSVQDTVLKVRKKLNEIK